MLRVASAACRSWTWLYTMGLPTNARDRRRAEIESDLWEQQDAARGESELPSIRVSRSLPESFWGCLPT
ncbi:MAG: hypothetical protein ABR529_00285 [Actinomycetota bacterium]